MHQRNMKRLGTNSAAVMMTRRRFLAAASALGCAAGLGPARAGAPEQAAAKKESRKMIDCHLHIKHGGRSLADTIKHVEATGAEKAIILPLETGEGGVLLTTDEVLQAYHQHPDRVIPFCQCDVRRPDARQRIRRYFELGCRGVGEQKEHLPLGDPRIESVIALCDELNCPITLHFQDNKKGYNQGLADHLERYLKKYQRVRIFAHAQTWWAHISADVPDPEKILYPTGPVKPGGLADRLLSDYPNLYADLSAGSAYNALTRDKEFTAGYLERHRKQLLFASDCPCTDGRGGNFKGGCLNTRLQELLTRMVQDKESLQDIFYNNAIRALNGA